MTRRPEIYASLDIEADGPTPLRNSMLSFGVALFDIEMTLLDVFYRTLHPLPDAAEDAPTMEWWRGQPEAWAAATKDRIDPKAAISDYHAWLDGWTAKAKVVETAWPLKYDGAFMLAYEGAFGGRTPLGHSGICLRSIAMALSGGEFRDCGKSSLDPALQAGGIPHDHVALNDAVDQGVLGINLLRKARGLAPAATIRNACGWIPIGGSAPVGIPVPHPLR